MFTPRSILALFVAAQLVAYCVGQIAGSLVADILIPLWKTLGGAGEMALFIGHMDAGHFIGSVFSALLTLGAGVLVLMVLLRFGWPWLSKTLRLDPGDPPAKQ